MARITGIGAIFGIVSEDGIAKTASPVNLYNRTTGQLISRQLTKPDGGFVFNGLNQNSSEYLLTATDEDGTVPKNALSQDRVQPIPAHSGATFWGNWANLSRTLGAVGGYAGGADGDNAPQPLDCGYVFTSGSPPIYDLPGMSPGAPNIATIALNASNIVFPAASAGARQDGWGNPAQISYEFVFDPTTATTTDMWTGALFSTVGYWAGDGDSSHHSGIAFAYTQATKILTLYRSTGGTNDTYTSYLTPAGTVNLSTAAGPVHIIGTIAYGVAAKIYVNGTLSSTVDISGTNTWFWGSSNTQGNNPEFRGSYYARGDRYSPLTSSGTTVHIGATATYRNKVLTQEEVTRLYQALMVGTTPNITGFAKEVVLDLPMWYYRFNDADVATTAQEFLSGETSTLPDSRAARTYAPTSLVTLAPSIVTGGNAITFAGGGFRAQMAGITSTERRGFTYAFIINPTGTPTADEYLMVERASDDTEYTRIRRTTSNTLTVTVMESGAAKDYAFTTALATGVDQHVFIVIDKRALTLDLWIGDVNGITKVETLTPAATILDYESYLTYRQDSHAVCFGGRINNAITAGVNMFKGNMAEWRLFPRALTPDRILAQNAAMTTI